MKPKFSPIPMCLLVAVAFVNTGCRAVQINDMEKRIDKLESRVSVLEARCEMLQKK
jgi:hypothetical protein